MDEYWDSAMQSVEAADAAFSSEVRDKRAMPNLAAAAAEGLAFASVVK
jgi:hypothetical protein